MICWRLSKLAESTTQSFSAHNTKPKANRSNLVITTLFHGTILSIANGKPFISLEKKPYFHMESKILHLLKGAGMEDRYFNIAANIDAKSIADKAYEMLAYDAGNYEELKFNQRQLFDPISDYLSSFY